MKITFKIKNIEDVKKLLSLKFGNVYKFCEKNNFPYPSISAVLNKRTKKYFYIKRICKILEIDIEEIEEWKDL